MEIVQIIAQWLGAIVALLSGALAISLLIPGEQPDRFLQGAVDFLKKLSLKPKE